MLKREILSELQSYREHLEGLCEADPGDEESEWGHAAYAALYQFLRRFGGITTGPEEMRLEAVRRWKE